MKKEKGKRKEEISYRELHSLLRERGVPFMKREKGGKILLFKRSFF